MHEYSSQWVANYFDDYSEKEWERLVKTPTEEVKLFIHTHYLKEYIRSGDYVLEIGAGAGRFTQILVELGARVIVADISEKQLNLNKKYAEELGFIKGIEDWFQLDICDMKQLENHQFDSVVCYGGPLSYVFDRRDIALQEILRVLKCKGKALLSVMSLWGSIHEFLPSTLKVTSEDNANIIKTGDLCPENFHGANHHCHLFRAQELVKFLEINQTQILTISASNCLSAAWGERLLEIRQDTTKWQDLLLMELEASREQGCSDMGTHIIAIVEK
ncbi:class I SAM-dependent methyltransferase [Rivularia sp. UHCC 0363]|uniref:class I SAM-dependent methyltransferase n=1 Tax=Rivularia sp. UHCC 0363 TaxID=3110244 RepID=UPI002B22070A|nr:class I SAM-dependent methyltransferase [Rivularia sp. UHCC 0363]MEA5596258.1 class I SAM-dependent methyltransferase [Rivularia sp. UHCC 0363]